MRVQKGAVIAVLLFAGFFAVGGYFTYADQRDGTPAVATVTDCTERLAKYGGDICRGQWSTSGGGTTTGTVEGVNHGDEGERVEVRVNGDRAVVPGMRLPIILWGIAAVILAFGGFQIVKDARLAAQRPADGGTAAT